MTVRFVECVIVPETAVIVTWYVPAAELTVVLVVVVDPLEPHPTVPTARVASKRIENRPAALVNLRRRPGNVNSSSEANAVPPPANSHGRIAGG